MDGASEIDLYDNIDEDFVQESADITELYDDVIAPISAEVDSTALIPKNSINSSSHTGRRIALYVGNLTWWTTDADLFEAAAKLGILDVIEIKFHENRQNGQSKGFCVMVFGSDQSARLALDRLPKLEINGQNPIVTICSKQNLSLFEKAASGESQSVPQRSEDTTWQFNGLSARVPSVISNPNMPASLGFSLRNNAPLINQSQLGIPDSANFSHTIKPLPQNPSIVASASQLSQLPVNFPTTSNVLISGIPSSNLINAPTILQTAFSIPPTICSLSASNPHVNPTFLQQPPPTGVINNSVPPTNAMMQLGIPVPDANRPQFDPYGRPIIHTYTPSGGKISDTEFEDILQRNKTVSSSAINRAVQDAADGDYASAIETLSTAISLIKQSKIASEDRCRILITSLQDTLHGIESKSYAPKSSSRRRRRSYSNGGSDAGADNYGNSNSNVSSSSRRHRDRSRRSRSRDHHSRHDRHDRHRHSRDRTLTGGVGYYETGSLSNSTITGNPSSNMGLAGSTGTIVGGSDRFRESRYRH